MDENGFVDEMGTGNFRHSTVVTCQNLQMATMPGIDTSGVTKQKCKIDCADYIISNNSTASQRSSFLLRGMINHQIGLSKSRDQMNSL